MKATPQLQPQLHNLDQSLWLDNVTQGLVSGRALRRYVDELSATYRAKAIRIG
jgi:hypothetical protein